HTYMNRTNAAKSPPLVDENVIPYWIRSRMLASAPRMMSRTRRRAASDGGFVDANQRSTRADFAMNGCYRGRAFSASRQSLVSALFRMIAWKRNSRYRSLGDWGSCSTREWCSGKE